MKIYTSNFENMDRIIMEDKVTVAICLKCPTDYNGYWMPELAPPQEMLSEYHETWDEETYTEKYQKILSKLDAGAVYDKLQKYGAGKDVVMLCYEPAGEFCHRHLVGRWLEEQNIIPVEEWTDTEQQEMNGR